jgi:type IV pilus assembly protein PilY1
LHHTLCKHRWLGGLIAWTGSLGAPATTLEPTPSPCPVLTAGAVVTWGQPTVSSRQQRADAQLFISRHHPQLGSAQVLAYRLSPNTNHPEPEKLWASGSPLGDTRDTGLWLAGPPSRMAFEHHQHKRFRNEQASRPSTLYVGSHTGVLTGLDANSGQLVMAYQAPGLNSREEAQNPSNEAPRYFANGPLFVGDADLSLRRNATSTAANWRSLLVGALGLGGKGFLVLDVTLPHQPQLLLDSTGSNDRDLGHVLGQPVVDVLSGQRSEQIVKMNDGRWALVMGNGYNSRDERPVLLVQYLDGDRALSKVVANPAPSQGNGLSAPRLIDINGDGQVDVAYAGDLRGQLWKFDLSAPSPSQWAVAGTGPLMVARDASGQEQAITTAPVWLPTGRGGVQIAFGTGQNWRETESSTGATQSVYAFWDDATYTVSPDQVSVLRHSTPIRDRSSLGSAQNGAATLRGWYLDLPLAGERVLQHLELLAGQHLLFASTVPAAFSSPTNCSTDPSKQQYANVLQLFTGLAPSSGSSSQGRWRMGSNGWVRQHKGKSIELIAPLAGPACPGDQLCTNRITWQQPSAPAARADWREIR